MGLVAQAADRFAHVLDDDDLLKAVIDSIHARTGRVIGADTARRIAADILGASKNPVGEPDAYVAKAITKECDPVGRWLHVVPDLVQPPLLLPVEPQHEFQPDGSGAQCEECGLPKSNGRHREAS